MNEITTRILKILLMTFAVVLASTIFYHLLFQDYETETAVYYEVSDVSAFQGVYVRDETPVPYSGSGAVRYCVNDGAKVGVGSVIAEVYADGEQIDLRSRIAAKENELAMLRQVEDRGTIANAQPVSLASQISEQFRGMLRLREQQNYADMRTAKQNLTVLMSTYAKVTDKNVDYTARIVSLEDELNRLDARLLPAEQVVTADKSAYFVSYVDGYEDKLKLSEVDKITPQDLADITDDGIAGSSSGAIGKLIDGYKWAIVGVFDNTKLRLSEGDTATVRLESVKENIKVTVDSLRSAGDVTKTQGVLRCEQMTGDVVQHRTERVEILRETIAGVRVPRSAIRFKDVEETVTLEDETSYTETVNCMGVYVLVGEKAEFRRLDIIYESEGYYLSSLHAGSDYVSLYDDVIVKGVMADGG